MVFMRSPEAMLLRDESRDIWDLSKCEEQKPSFSSFISACGRTSIISFNELDFDVGDPTPPGPILVTLSGRLSSFPVLIALRYSTRLASPATKYSLEEYFWW